MPESTLSGTLMSSLKPQLDGFSLEALVSKTGYFLIGVFVVFVVLGSLVIFGLRSEVSSILTGIFEGTIQIIEVVKFVKELWRGFLEVLKEILNFISPIVATVISAASYWFLMWLYKYVGKNHDVTLLTIILTVVLVSILNLFWGPKERKQAVSFWQKWSANMSLYLMNSYEIMLFVFFLTLDWENPVFLSRDLWGGISAKVGELDLMVRGINWETDFSFTLWLAGLALFFELLRRVLKVWVLAMNNYRSAGAFARTPRLVRFRESLVGSFNKSLDGIVKFFGYTTVVTLVFFLFPRLKLLSLAFFSLTNLFWDFLNPKRLLVEGSGQDLLSMVIINVFRL